MVAAKLGMDIKETKFILKKFLERYDQNKNDKSFITNEKNVCESLILPFIREIWHYDTTEPSEFRLEHSTSGKRADYIVYNQGISQFIIEAKAASKELRLSHNSQVLNTSCRLQLKTLASIKRGAKWHI